MKRIHIIGPPRSGTTLMLELMINGFQFSSVSSKEISLLTVPQGVPEDGTVCTKKPQDHRLVSALIDRDENQWFISMVRDPRDIICSRHGLHPEVYWANLRQWRGWLDNTRPFRSHPRLVEIRYEELVTQPDMIQQRLAGHLSTLPIAGRFSDFHRVARPSSQSLRAMGQVRPLSGSSVGKWRDNLPRVAGQIRIHGPIDQELIELGYEQDAQWLSLLDDVEPDMNPGHWPDFLPPEFAQNFRRQQNEKLNSYIQVRGL